MAEAYPRAGPVSSLPPHGLAVVVALISGSFLLIVAYRTATFPRSAPG